MSLRRAFALSLSLFLAAAAPAWAAGEAALLAAAEAKAGQITGQDDARLKRLTDMAADPVLKEYFAAPPKPSLLSRLLGINQAIATGQAGLELCLIDSQGNEHLRTVRGRLAPQSELAHDETDAPFFATSVALQAGASHVAPPYLSPDADEWVQGYTVPVVPGVSFLHIEFPLSDLQRLLDTKAGPETKSREFLLVVDHDGYVVADSRAPVATANKAGKSLRGDYFAHLRRELEVPGPVVATILDRRQGSQKTTFGDRPAAVAWSHTRAFTVVAVALD